MATNVMALRTQGAFVPAAMKRLDRVTLPFAVNLQRMQFGLNGLTRDYQPALTLGGNSSNPRFAAADPNRFSHVELTNERTGQTWTARIGHAGDFLFDDMLPLQQIQPGDSMKLVFKGKNGGEATTHFPARWYPTGGGYTLNEIANPVV